ncbi:MAG: hypothetical protein BGO48_00055 [Mucilaginibacter sp. 44-25]|nr:MAG: hypothetical protein BGO48_00055 [Mucilaginibacter sp. 44-25]
MVTNKKGISLDAATATLYQKNQIVTSNLSKLGKIDFTGLTNGEYEIKVSLVGFQSIVRKFDMPKDSLLLVMNEAISQLKTVNIISKIPPVEHKTDRTTYNIQNSILAGGSNIWDILKKLPSVITSDNGQITSSGKGVTVYIDNKPVHLTGDELVTYLSSLPADQISKLDIVTSPSAKYDAQGGAILNIVRKKISTDGLNAQFSSSYTQATLGSYTTSAIFNEHHKKTNFYGSFGHSDQRRKRQLSDYTKFSDSSRNSFWDGKGTSTRKNITDNYQVGLDWVLTDRQIIAINVTGYYSKGNTILSDTKTVYNNFHSIADSTLLTTNDQRTNTRQLDVGMSYKLKIDSGKQSIDFNFDYLPYHKKAEQYVQTITDFQNSPLKNTFDIFTPNSQEINIYTSSLNHSYHLKNNWDLESGIKYTSINTLNNYSFYNISGNSKILDPAKSNLFDYKENTSAAYTNIKGTAGFWSFQGGVRIENTNTTGSATASTLLTKTNYLKVFPSAQLIFSPNTNNNIALSYEIRIDRPEFQQLNPARFYTSPYSYAQGNAYLRPYYSTNLDLTYTYKEHYTLTTYFTDQENFISDVPVQNNSDGTLYFTQLNIGNTRNIGFIVLTTVNPTPWWDATFSFNGYHSAQKSNFPNGEFSSNKWNTEFSSNQTFVISKSQGIKAELAASYNSRFLQGVLNIYATNNVSFGASKQLFRKRATLKIALNDIFYGNPYRLATLYADQNNGSYQRNDTRNISVSFTCRLGNFGVGQNKKNKNVDDERRRIN